jgi:hypothetical protein
MDSKNIFILSQTYSNKINWEKVNPDSEWTFIGGDKMKAKDLLDSFFNNELSLYLIIDRHNSKQDNKPYIFEKIKEYLEQRDFLIWDLNFNKIIEFNKVGVYRVGKRNLK